jgi:hypothetical protein
MTSSGRARATTKVFFSYLSRRCFTRVKGNNLYPYAIGLHIVTNVHA